MVYICEHYKVYILYAENEEIANYEKVFKNFCINICIMLYSQCELC